MLYKLRYTIVVAFLKLMMEWKNYAYGSRSSNNHSFCVVHFCVIFNYNWGATDLFIGENPLEKVQNYKYLGMWLDINLDWHYHIDVMRSKISRRIGVCR